MNKKEHLANFINAVINKDESASSEHFRKYMLPKSREIFGLKEKVETTEANKEETTDDEDGKKFLKNRDKKKEPLKKMKKEKMDEAVVTEATKHTCNDGKGPNFGKKTKGCPRCDELSNGAAPTKWGTSKKASEALRAKDMKDHDCKKSKCGPVCTYGDW